MSYRRHLMIMSDKPLITREMNAPLMDALYANNMCKHPDYMTKRECDRVTYIPGNFAKSNTSLASIDELKYFENCYEIRYYAFYECTNLNIVTLPPNLYKIGTYAFSKCSSITHVELPSTVRVTDNSNSFAHCTNLETINLDNVTNVGQSSFMNDDKIRDMGFTGNIVTVTRGYSLLTGFIDRLFLPSLTSKYAGAWRVKRKAHLIFDIGAKVTALEMGWRWADGPLVLRAPNPPTLTMSGQAQYISRIFVHASSVQAYIDSDWGTQYPNIICAIGGAEWQEQFADAPNPADEYADVRLYAPVEYVDAYIEKYELAKNSVTQQTT